MIMLSCKKQWLQFVVKVKHKVSKKGYMQQWQLRQTQKLLMH